MVISISCRKKEKKIVWLLVLCLLVFKCVFFFLKSCLSLLKICVVLNYHIALYFVFNINI